MLEMKTFDPNSGRQLPVFTVKLVDCGCAAEVQFEILNKPPSRYTTTDDEEQDMRTLRMLFSSLFGEINWDDAGKELYESTPQEWWIFEPNTGQLVAKVPANDEDTKGNGGLPAWFFEVQMIDILVDHNKGTTEWTPAIGPAPCWEGKLGTPDEVWAVFASWAKETYDHVSGDSILGGD